MRRLWVAVAIIAALILALVMGLSSAAQGRSYAAPAYCYSTKTWLPFPDFSGYCPDGESPFNGPGPSYGGSDQREGER